MSFTGTLVGELSERHLLKHPFYQAWSDGSLPLETIREYAAQYYGHVLAFPRYLSATHSGCEDAGIRQMLLENLVEEERGSENHPELWLRFAEGLGMTREEVLGRKPMHEITAVIDTFLTFARRSYEEGLGALFAYEHQIPEIAHFKLEALQKHYGVVDARGTSFFEVHRKADVYHTQAISEALDKLPADAQARARAAAHEAGQRLWDFLSAMQKPCAA